VYLRIRSSPGFTGGLPFFKTRAAFGYAFSVPGPSVETGIDSMPGIEGGVETGSFRRVMYPGHGLSGLVDYTDLTRLSYIRKRCQAPN
jgi:hypothetical protein